MNAKPTYDSLLPREAGPFSRRQQRNARAENARQARWGGTPSRTVLPAAFDAKAMVAPTAVAAIRKAFTLSKTSHDAWRSVQREGRFDIRQAPRISRGAQDVFKRKSGTSTTRVKVSVLIDSSGSMSNTDALIQNPVDPTQTIRVDRRMAAALFGATIAEAIGRVPTVDLDIFQHAAANRLFIKWRWSKGTPVAVFNAAATESIGAGGNADGHALYAITTRMQREIRHGEKGIIMIVSDGLPSDYARNATATASERTAGQALIDAVAYARKAGFTVIAVAIDGSDQSAYYGEKGVVRFTNGNWTALGSALARVIGDAMVHR